MQILNFLKKLLVLLCGTKQHREETCSRENALSTFEVKQRIQRWYS